MRALREGALRLVHRAWQAAAAVEVMRFGAAASQLERSAARRMQRLLRSNASTTYGRAHGFSSIQSIAEFQRRVPIVRYADIAHHVSDVAAGKRGVLTASRPAMMERTSGSTALGKLIPYTPELRGEINRAVAVWMAGILRDTPQVIGRRAYISISPLPTGPRRTPGNIPIGFEDDTGYLATWSRIAARMTLVGGGSLSGIADLAAWRHATALALLEADDLGLISVWSPDFLTLLLDLIAANWGELLAQLSPDRRAVLGRLSAPDPARIWPHLAVISCWTDGQAAAPAAVLQARCPAIPLQAKGLIATEGVVSVPIRRGLPPALAVTSHFYEFIDLSSPTKPTLLAHELRTGGDYSPVLTTGGGLYRYHLADAVRCEGHWRSAPLLTFRGKLDGVADLRGEKLDPPFVTDVVGRALTEGGLDVAFVLLSPDGDEGSVHYTLFVETTADDGAIANLAARVETLLSGSRHYRLCRDLGQLGPVLGRRVTDGRQRRVEALVRLGLRPGDIKPSILDTRCNWPKVFGPAAGEAGAE